MRERLSRLPKYISYYSEVASDGAGRRKTGKHGKVRERKLWVLAQSPYSPKGNERQSPRVNPGG